MTRPDTHAKIVAEMRRGSTLLNGFADRIAALSAPAGCVVRDGEIERILRDYRCSRQNLEDAGGGLPLADALTPAWANSISEGLAEIDALADYLGGELLALAAAPNAPAPQPQGDASGQGAAK